MNAVPTPVPTRSVPNADSADSAPVEPRSVYLIDDHLSYTDLLSAALVASGGFVCVGSATTARRGVPEAARLQPAIVVVDLQLPGEDGLQATRQLRELCPGTAVAVVTAHQGGTWAVRAQQAGASAYIPKDGSLSTLVQTLRTARPGEMSGLPAATVRRSDGQLSGPAEVPVFTGRELDALTYVCAGLQTKQAARAMGISIHTCRGYIKSVYLKLHVTTRIDAMNSARRLNLVSGSDGG